MELNRRAFLKGAALGVVGIASLGSAGVLEGCSSSSGSSDSQNTYTAVAKGCHGDITVTAVIKSGKIQSLSAQGPLETPNVGGLALRNLPPSIVSANSLSVDVVSGATTTSTAILKATAYCLGKAGQSVNVAPATQTYTPGTYSATSKGHMGPLAISVTFSDHKIEKLELGANTETPHLVKGAFDALSTQIVADQSLAVDAVTTATYSSRAILNDVADCVKQAGGDPFKLRRPLLSNPKPASDDTTSTDVVIVGGGTSGSIALYRIASSGLKAICVESSPVVGGMGEISGFMSMLWYGSNLQKKALGLSDDYIASQVKTQTLKMLTAVTYEVDSRMLQRCAKECGPMVDMLYGSGMAMTVNNDTGVSIPIKGKRFQLLHEKAAKDYGAQTLRSHRVDQLLKDDQGKITGVIATRPDGSHLTIYAKAVILCAGGACANQDMMIKYFPDYVDSVENCAISSDDGSALAAAWNAGAGKGMFGVHAHNHTLPLSAKYAGISTVEATDPVASVGNIPLLWLNREGVRWANETNAFSPTPGGNTVFLAKKAFNVLDQPTVDEFISKGSSIKPWRGIAVGTPMPDLAQQLAAGEATGYVYKATTIDELAKKTGWNPDIAKAQIERYNKIVEMQNDTDYYKDAAYLKYKITTAPFYAIELRPRCLGSFGGFVLSGDYEILKDDGFPIPGLFAAGDVACGWFGRTYPNIDGLTSFHNTTSGYVAANSAINYLN